MRFTPDFELRDEADGIWDDAHNALGKLPDGADALTVFNLGEYLRNLGGLIGDHPIPKNADEQSAFDGDMRRYIHTLEEILAELYQLGCPWA